LARSSPGEGGIDARQRCPAPAGQQLPDEVELDHEAGGRGRPAEALEQPVVAAALRDRPAEVRTVAFEDDAGVIVEVADGAKVEAYAPVEPVRDQELLDPPQL